MARGLCVHARHNWMPTLTRCFQRLEGRDHDTCAICVWKTRQWRAWPGTALSVTGMFAAFTLSQTWVSRCDRASRCPSRTLTGWGTGSVVREGEGIVAPAPIACPAARPRVASLLVRGILSRVAACSLCPPDLCLCVRCCSCPLTGVHHLCAVHLGTTCPGLRVRVRHRVTLLMLRRWADCCAVPTVHQGLGPA
jgi:hypothetical protein